jgi:serine protease AprX
MRPENGRRFGLICVALALMSVHLASGDNPTLDLPAPALVGADALHQDGITGLGVTVAAITGVTAPGPGVPLAADGHDRLLAGYDAVSAAEADPVVGRTGSFTGEGTAQLTAMLSSRRDAEGRYLGVAPNSDLVLVRALGADGSGRAVALARAVDWVVANRQRFGIRVLHLPLAPAAGGSFQEGLLGQALAGAWEAGIVVVTASSEAGSAPVRLQTAEDPPHLIAVAPAAAVSGELLMPQNGTAISSAIVGGVVALMLEASPWLTPDEVKARLLASSRLAAAPSDLGDGGWSESAARGITWADLAVRGITWAD